MSAVGEWRRRRDRAAADERIREAGATGGKADLRGLDLTGADFSRRELVRVVFGDHEGGTPPARLGGARFDGARLDRCRLADCDLDRVSLKGARLERCDLRYAVIRSGTFEDATLASCDLYRAAFEGGTVLENARLADVSLDHVRLDGMLNLTPAAFGERPGDRRLLQEDAEAYGGFLRAGRWYRRLHARDPDAAEEFVRTAIARGYDDAAAVYRRLAGMWSSGGEYRHASWAYVRARRLERRSLASSHDGTPSNRAQWALMGAADGLSGYGESPLRIVRAAALLVLLPALLYGVFGGVHVDGAVERGPVDMVLFSLGQMTTAGPERLEAAGRLAELGGELQTLLGIVLLGLLGFVLGNRIRMS